MGSNWKVLCTGRPYLSRCLRETNLAGSVGGARGADRHLREQTAHWDLASHGGTAERNIASHLRKLSPFQFCGFFFVCVMERMHFASVF